MEGEGGDARGFVANHWVVCDFFFWMSTQLWFVVGTGFSRFLVGQCDERRKERMGIELQSATSFAGESLYP